MMQTILNERALIAGLLANIAEVLADGSLDETNVIIAIAFILLRLFVKPAPLEEIGL